MCCFINYCGQSNFPKETEQFHFPTNMLHSLWTWLVAAWSSFKADMLLGFVLKPVQHYILLKLKWGWITCSTRRVKTVLDVSTDVNTVSLHGNLQQWLIFPGSLLCKHCVNSNSWLQLLVKCLCWMNTLIFFCTLWPRYIARALGATGMQDLLIPVSNSQKNIRPPTLTLELLWDFSCNRPLCSWTKSIWAFGKSDRLTTRKWQLIQESLVRLNTDNGRQTPEHTQETSTRSTHKSREKRFCTLGKK